MSQIGNKNNKYGYILILSLMIIGLSMALLTTVYSRFFVYQDSIRVFMNKEQVKLLVQSGIQVALSQISLPIKDKDNVNNSDSESKKELSPDQKWLTQVLPILNKWQSFNLSDKGILQVYISSENGKINLNQFMDIEKTEIKETQVRQLDAEGRVAKKDDLNKEIKKSNPESALVDILKGKLNIDIGQLVKLTTKKLNRPLISSTEVLSPKSENIYNNLFIKSNLYSSVYDDSSSNSKDDKKNNFMDLFTVFTESFKINPWVLSKNTAKILGLKPLIFDKESGITTKEIIKKFKPKLNLEKDFDAIFKKIYGKTFDSLGKAKEFFMTDFDIDALSVICHAKAGDIVQGIYAILERDKDPQGFSKNAYIFNIKRIYWI